MNQSTKKFIKRPHLAQAWVFFIATYAWTWSFFGIAYWLGLSAETGGLLGACLVLIALSGPAVMAMTFVKLTLNKEGQKDYWQRIIDTKRISGKWYLASLLMIPSIAVLSAILSGYWPFLTFVNVTPSLLLTAIVVPFVPFVEELGWRGYALDRLQERTNALHSSLILGLLWGFWHLPAFFLAGGGLSVMPFASLAFWEYMGGLIALSICMTWIYNNTNRSTLSAVLFHMVLEFCADTGLFPWGRPDLAFHLGVHIGLWAIVALGITLYNGASKLSKHSSDIKLDFGGQDKPSKPTRPSPKIKCELNTHQHGVTENPKYTPYRNTQKSPKDPQSHENEVNPAQNLINITKLNS